MTITFTQIHFCAEEIMKEFLRFHLFDEFESERNQQFTNRRLGLFKNIIISQLPNKRRENKWAKGNHGQWNLTHQAGKGADKNGKITLERGYSVQFSNNQDSYIIRLMRNDEQVTQISFQQNWDVIALEDFRTGKNYFRQHNPHEAFVVEEDEYRMYIEFLSSLFSIVKEPTGIEPYYTAYLALFNSYNSPDTSEEAEKVIETTMGAMIFYMPQRVEQSWSRRISHQCLLQSVQQVGYKKVKDHEIPRKLSARECLKRPIPFDFFEFQHQYWERYSSFTYVTTEENMRLINWYHNKDNQDKNGQVDYTLALNNLNIECFNFGENFNHKNINRVIKRIAENTQLNHSIWSNELEEFIRLVQTELE